MADLIEDTSVTYEELADLEKEFEDNETEIMRQQIALDRPLYEKRAKLVAKVPNFWPLVLEQAPQEIDQYISPSDSAVLLSSLETISVSHFEVEDGGKGHPRSVAIKMEFSENDLFEDKVLEKKFCYRRSRDGFAGLVSEPVPIKWKAGKDPTHGMLDLVIKVWEQDKKRSENQTNGDKAGRNDKRKKSDDRTPEENALKEKISATSIGGMSFFAWFGYRGFDISEEESLMATEEDKKQRTERAESEAPELIAAGAEIENADDEEEEQDDDDESLEIFPDGDEVAIAFAEDLWPHAIKYFTQAQEAEAISDVDFEEDEEEMGEEDEEGVGEANATKPPNKKRKL